VSAAAEVHPTAFSICGRAALDGGHQLPGAHVWCKGAATPGMPNLGALIAAAMATCR